MESGDRDSILEDHQYEMDYGESNRHVTDDCHVTQTGPKDQVVNQIRFQPNISETAGDAI